MAQEEGAFLARWNAFTADGTKVSDQAGILHYTPRSGTPLPRPSRAYRP